MRIIMAHKEYSIRSGASRHVFELTKLLEGAGHEVIPFSMTDKRNQSSPYEKYFVSSADFSTPRFSLPLFFRNLCRMLWSREAARKMKQLIADTKPDLVHVHNIYHQISPSILPVIKQAGLPIVQTLHDYKIMCPNYLMRAGDHICEKCKYRRYYQPFFQKCVKNSRIASAMVGLEMAWHKILGVYEKNVDVFISPSLFLQNKLKEWRIKARRVEYLPNFFAAVPPRRNDDGKYILYGLARLSEEKGLWALMMAAKNLPDIPFKVWGEGILRPRLEEFVRQQRMINVEFLGDPKTPPASNCVKNAFAVVAPSEWYENNSYALIEAMAYGKPFIASNIGGNPELAGSNERGLLFTMGEAEALAGKIRELWTKPDLARSLGEAGQIYVKEKLSGPRYLNSIQAIYRSVL